MNKHRIFALLGLTLIWIILREDISWFTLVTGLVVSFGCLWFAWKFLPIKPIQNVRFSRLALYPFFLIGEIYVQGFQVIRFILTGARAHIVEIKTGLKSDFLKALLMGSITLTPGTITLDLKGRNLTILNLSNQEGADIQQSVEDGIGRLEKQLIKAQK